MLRCLVGHHTHIAAAAAAAAAVLLLLMLLRLLWLLLLLRCCVYIYMCVPSYNSHVLCIYIAAAAKLACC